MIIAIYSENKQAKELAGKIICEHLSSINFETKSINSLSEYKPNRVLFGGGDDFSNWVITDFETEEQLNQLKTLKSFFISIAKPGQSIDNEFDASSKYTIYYDSDYDALKKTLEDILVKEKLMYPLSV
jgi:hypothetical protein